MAEKNTLSILESIKKKMQKLDQKPKKSEIAASEESEFEYIAPIKKDTVEAVADGSGASEGSLAGADSDIDPMFENDFEDEVKVNPTENAEANLKAKKDAAAELKMDPISMTSEENKLPEVEDENFSEQNNDLPSLSKMPPIAPPEKLPVNPAMPDLSKQKEEAAKNLSPIDLPKDDDLDFNDFDLDDDVAAAGPVSDSAAPEVAVEVEQDPILEIEDVAMEEVAPEAANQAPVASANQNPASDNIDDLNLDDLSLEDEEEIAAPAPAQNKKPTIDDLDDIDLEDLLKDEHLESTPAVKKAEPTVEAAEESFEIEEEVAANAAEEQKPAKKSYDNIDDIDLDSDLENMELEAPEVAINQEQISKPALMDEVANSSRRASLIRDEVIHETSQSIKKLIDAKNTISGVKSFSQTTALNDLAIQILEPKLDKWLNDHLPQLVEQIVQDEIKKIFNNNKDNI